MSRDPSSSADLSLQLAGAFAAFGPTYFKWIQSRFAASGVSFARMKLLGVLHRTGPQIMSGLSDELGVTPRNVTALVDGLEEEGLVRRVPHPTDRRATVVELTETGAEYGCQMAAGGHLDAIAELFRELTPADQRELIRLLGLLREGLARRGFGSGPPAAPGC
ncbi:MAG TPA: MarR family transcriptional regulator [Gemmataceae bacterium]|nr:MarR family transcriptional regulator [Gemmataceae bacterium]